MIIRSFKFFMFCIVFLSFNAYSYVLCEKVPVRVMTANNAGFHNLSEVGMTGSVIFVGVPPANCSDSTGSPMSATVFFVLDEMESSSGIKNIWASMLFSAEARGKTIRFHAYDRGTNSRGFQVLSPYFMTTDN